VNRFDQWIRSIVENPEDLDLRLVFADWLEDHPRPGREVVDSLWASWIRDDIFATRRGEGSVLSTGLEACLAMCGQSRDDEGRWGPEWSDDKTSRAKVINGFVEVVKCPLKLWMEHATKILPCQPVKWIRIEDVEPEESVIHKGCYYYDDYERELNNRKEEPCNVPRVYYKRLREIDRNARKAEGDKSELVYFNNEEQARMALNIVALNVEREKVSLPPLWTAELEKIKRGETP